MRLRLSIISLSVCLVTSAFASSEVEASPAPPPLPAPIVFVDQDPAAKNAESRAIEIYLQHAKSFSVPGITGALTMDPNSCSAEVRPGQIEVLGLTRGDCVVIYWTKGGQTNLLIHVVDPPVVAPPPSLARAVQFGTTGFVRTFVTSNIADQSKSVLLQNQFAWNSSLDADRQLSFQATTEDGLQRVGHGFNFTTFSASLKLPNYLATIGDFSVVARPSGFGGSHQFASPVLTLRGADVRITRGKNVYEIFAGSGIPSFFLNYGGVAHAAGVDYQREIGEKMSLLIQGLYSSVQNDNTGSRARQNDFTLLPVVSYRVSKRMSLEAGAGLSNHGLRLTAEGTYSGERFDLFGAFSRMGASFPLQLLRAGTTAGENLALGGSFRLTSSLSVAGTYQRGLAGFENSHARPAEAASNLAVSSQYTLNSRHVINAAYSVSTSPNTVATLGLRHFDASVSSLLGSASNSFQFSMVRTSDAGNTLGNHSELSFADGVRFGLTRGMQLSGSVSYARTNFPLLARIQQQLTLLDPQLQQLFTRDPAAFLNSNLLPPDVRAAVDSVQPSSVQFTGGAEFSRGRWNLAPHASFGLQNVAASGNRNLQFGYHASYAISSSLWLTSSLSSQYFVSGSRLQRSHLITFGLQRTLTANPFEWLTQKFARRSIHGTVFIDRDEAGVLHSTDARLAGIRVRLSNGTIAITGPRGEFEFHGLAPRVYHVNLDSNQFRTAVRLTGASEVITDLSADVSREVNFGVVDFARITGVVYNDYLMTGERQPDAPRVSGIRLQLTRSGAAPLNAKTDAGGDFDAAGLEPGHYEVSIERDSLPAGYYVGGEIPGIDVLPASSIRIEVPVLAMRSISGKVLYRGAENSVPSPVAGVKVTADRHSVITTAEGAFLFRDLPAGEVTVRVLSASGELPGNLQLPQGKISMPRDPKQIENATIVITSPELLKYLTSQGTK